MAFKKTSEGRVFFQGSNGNGGSATAAKTASAPSQAQPSSHPSAQNQPGPTQLQILALLRSLNEKLKSTQVERNDMRAELENYRRSMEALQDKAHKAERAEQIAQETFKELEETRKLLLDLEERQAGIEKENRENSEKIRVGVGSYRDLTKRVETAEQKQEEIGRKVEETVTQQARVMRQVEKAIEDRTRFMRKIERIEETVIQTRDALNAKAMVLLTDQNISGAGGISPDIDGAQKAPSQEPGIPAALPGEEAATPDVWTNARKLQGAAILLLVAGGILAGWAVSEVRRSPLADASGEFQITEHNSPGETTPEDQVDANAEKAGAIVEKWRIAEDTAGNFSEARQDAPVVEALDPAALEQKSDPTDDLGTLDVNDTEKLQRMLEEDPDKLAAELNKIEPSSPSVQEDAATPQDIATQGAAGLSRQETPLEETPGEMQVASLPVEKTSAIERDEAPAPQTPAAPVYKKSDIDVRSLIKPDSNLPPVVKKIETQAFDGSPEAQHDLAAIYTAGHGNVKQDFKRAMFWFEQSANAGVANAAYNLGVLHHQGLGTKPDLKKAIEWYTRAADLGHPEAQYNLGIAYIEGVGVEYDPFKANAYFEKAAAKGIMEASYNLGLIYENGLLGKAQPDEALVWYKDASDQGSPEAKAALEQLVKTLNIRMEDISKLVESVKLARKGGQPAPAPAAASPFVPKKEVRSSGVRSSEAALLAQIQEHLMGMGLYPGPADGSDSPLSQDAIRAYQQLNSLQTTGRPSAALLVHMLSENSEKTRAPESSEAGVGGSYN